MQNKKPKKSQIEKRKNDKEKYLLARWKWLRFILVEIDDIKIRLKKIEARLKKLEDSTAKFINNLLLDYIGV